MSLHPPKHDESPLLRDRSPRPYFLQDWSIPRLQRSRASSAGHLTPVTPSFNEFNDISESRRSSAPEQDGSESGTEADDERVRYLALPPATVRSRKGLKHSDGTVSPVLTPSQLDWQGQRLFPPHEEELRRSRRAREEDLAKLEEERREFQTRRRAERIRRLSEGALLAAIGAVVISGSRVWQMSWQWYLVEVLSQVSAITGLVAFYPLRLVSVEHDRGHVHIWSRFRVPPSFDPATVLYPTFLPVLVSLCLVRRLPALFLPNTILGLASLPPRLFPLWARAGEINTLHWMVSAVPLIASRAFGLLARKFPHYMAAFSAPESTGSIPDEWLLLVFPLHQAMLPALHYLTTSSLLPAEKHLLSTALINVLIFAESPQITILCTLLWVGGIIALVTCTHVLRWNIALARVPTWRLRDFRRSQNSSSLIAQLVGESFAGLRGFFRISKPRSGSESEDEDEPMRYTRNQKARRPSLVASATFQENTSSQSPDLKSGHQQSNPPWQERRDSKFSIHKRRNTIASPFEATFNEAISPRIARRRSSRKRDWVVNLTPFQATLRKRFYAGYVYVVLATIILLPVRTEISRHAFAGAEPIFWAIEYLFAVTSILHIITSTSSIPALRSDVGEANFRLILIAYYGIVLLIGLSTVLILSPTIEVDTRRKIFHAIMVCMFLPTIFVDPCFCALALALVLTIFLLLEVIRAGQVPPLGTAIGRFVAPYVDGRDLRGPMVVSHVFLLIGCAIPFWLSCAAFLRTPGGWELEGDKRETAMLSGVVCVGMGDAAASLIGRRFGRRKWPWIGGKSLEGSAAFALAVCAGLSIAKLWLRLGGWVDVNALSSVGSATEAFIFVTKALVAGCGASFMEAVLTGANDNVVVPVALWLLCRGLRL
ncbi:hypothetical protein K461DRAFT_34769 [Myriangium duriaei CBS 260.36]|uniref:dolichol kinase n=1 Tax=Myriangium duriaei CBS 260.36 TaxID=1168546 RepID=A0A9P4IWI4_9PEZI|nr:hypothetical protein K461DRAFT_34769 [Myriangium duriaei CBS 260.36]